MRTASRFALLGTILGCTIAVAAPPELKGPPIKAEAPPPPGLNDPGVTTPSAEGAKQGAAAPATAAEGSTSDPLAPLPKPDTRPVRDKSARDASATQQRIAESDVTTRKQGTDTVEEYRQHGRVWMIRIVRPNGPVQTFMDTTGSGRLTRDPREGPVSPVYFSLYEWN
jgi:hypothetical protein